MRVPSICGRNADSKRFQIVKTRQIWWQCSLEHEGCTPGHVVNTRERLQKLLTEIQTEHARREPSCPAELMRVGATKRGIKGNLGCVTFRITRGGVPAPYKSTSAPASLD
jgi:hypothetical protein